MKGIGGAIVGVTAVICAVFVPIAFLGGVTGTLYKQFAITITISTLLSAITALTLTPALCALILKPGAHKPRPIQAFDRFFEKLTGGYVGAVGFAIRRWVLFLLIYGAIIAGVVFLFKTHPRRLRAGGGQGHDVRRHRPALRRLAGARRRGAEARGDDGQGRAGGGRRDRHPRLLGLLPLRQPGLRVRHAEGLEGAQRPRPSTCWR